MRNGGKAERHVLGAVRGQYSENNAGTDDYLSAAINKFHITDREPRVTFKDLFPSLSLQPEANRLLDAPFDWTDPDLSVLDCIRSVQSNLVETDLERFWVWTESLLSDLAKSRPSNAGTAQDAIDCVRFISSGPAISLCQRTGQLGKCYEWIWIAVSHTFKLGGPRLQEATCNYLNLRHAPEALFLGYLEALETFVSGAFYVSYKFGGLDQLTASIANLSWDVLSKLPPELVGPEWLFARIQMVVWASHRKWEKGQTWAYELRTQYALDSLAAAKKNIAMAFMTPAYSYTERKPEDWAAIVLENYSAELMELEKLQTLAVLVKTKEQWEKHRKAILEEIASARAYFFEYLSSAEDWRVVLEQRFSILWPLLASLADFGDVQDFMEVLGAWYRRDASPASDANVLVVVPTRFGGASYVWPKGRLLTGDGTFTTHNDMQRTTGDAIGVYMRGTDGDRAPESFGDFRFDVPLPENSDAMEESLAGHYKFEELKKALPSEWSPRAVVVCPAGSEPFQTKLAKDTEIFAPIEASFELARPYRTIKKFSVWSADIFHATYEEQAIKLMAEQAGWELAIEQASGKNLEDFRAFYEDPDSDVLWIIAHGEHDPYDQNKSGIQISDSALVSLAELANFEKPSGDRRLVVMNTCSSGATQNRGGLAKIGVGQSIVSAHQAVLGHLWPTGSAPSLLFGVALVANLTEHGQDQAVLSAMRLLMKPDDIVAYIAERFAGAEELLERVNEAANRSVGIVNWGSPIFLT